MDTLSAMKLVKYTGLMVLFCSLGLVFLESKQVNRRWNALNWGMGIGFFLTWMGGYGMMKFFGYPMSTPWIRYSQFFSMMSLYFATQLVCGKKPGLCMFLSLSSLFFALIGMVLKASSLVLLKPFAVVSFMCMVYFWMEKTPGVRVNLSWFRLIAWLEGMSLLTLLFLYMPLKYWAAINLDQNQGWFGWTHGLLQIIFLLSLSALHSARRISFKQFIIGLGASTLPFGTMVFEKTLRS